MLSLVLEWLAENGGVEAAERRNQEKPTSCTAQSTQAAGFTRACRKRQPFSHERHVHPPRQQSHEKFVEEAKAAKMIGLGVPLSRRLQGVYLQRRQPG